MAVDLNESLSMLATRWGCLLLLSLALLLFVSCSHPVDSTERDETELKDDPVFKAFQGAWEVENREEAYRQAQVLVQKYPRNGSAWNKLAWTAEQLGNKKEALDDYLKAVRINPTHAKAWYNLGVLRGNDGALREEVRCYRKAVALRPDYGEAWLNLSIAETRLGEIVNSIKAYAKAVQLLPNLPRSFHIGENRDSVKGSVVTLEFPEKEETQTMKFQLPSPAVVSEAIHPPSFSSGPEISGRKLPLRPGAVFTLALSHRWGPGKVFFQKMNLPPDSKKASRELNNFGLAREAQQQWERAILDYRKALEDLRDDPLVWNNLGIAQVSAGRPLEGISSFEKALNLAPGSSKILRNLALAHCCQALNLISANQNSEAIIQLKEALGFQPDCPEALQIWIHLLETQNQWEDVLAPYQILGQKFPKSFAAWYGLGYAAYRVGKHPQAVEALSHAFQIKPEQSHSLFLLGVEQACLGSLPEAMVSLQRCAQLDPGNKETWLEMGIVLSRLQRWDEAREALQKSFKLKPGWFPPQLAMAEVMLESGHEKEALEQYEELLRKDSNLLEAWKGKAKISEAHGDWKNAIIACQHATEINGADIPSWEGLGYALSAIGLNLESCKAYQKAVSLGDSSLEILNNLGVAWSRTGEYAKALDSFNEAAQLQKNDPQILLNKGIVYHKLKRNKDARIILQQLQDLKAPEASQLTLFMVTTDNEEAGRSTP